MNLYASALAMKLERVMTLAVAHRSLHPLHQYQASTFGGNPSPHLDEETPGTMDIEESTLVLILNPNLQSHRRLPGR